MPRLPFSVSPVHSEFEGASFGDRRLQARLDEIVSRIETEPSRSFPKCATSVSNLEATYRFLNNTRVSAAKILAPHVEATWKRASFFQALLSVEDTTEMRFGGTSEREGLGLLINGGQGFHLHASLLVGWDGTRFVPLGLPAHEVTARVRKTTTSKGWREAKSDPHREKLRWHRVAKLVDDTAGVAAGVRGSHFRRSHR